MSLPERECCSSSKSKLVDQVAWARDLLYEKFVQDEEQEIDPTVMALAVDLLEKARKAESKRRKESTASGDIDIPSNIQTDAKLFPVNFKRKSSAKGQHTILFAKVQKHCFRSEKSFSSRTSIQITRDVEEYLHFRCDRNKLLMKNTINKLVQRMDDGKIIWQYDEPCLSIEQCIVIREYSRTSTRQLYHIFNAISILTETPRLHPTQFRTKMGDFENNFGC